MVLLLSNFFVICHSHYSYSDELIPKHPCFKLIANCEQKLTSKISRRLITMEKFASIQVYIYFRPIIFYINIIVHCQIALFILHRFINIGGWDDSSPYIDILIFWSNCRVFVTIVIVVTLVLAMCWLNLQHAFRLPPKTFVKLRFLSYQRLNRLQSMQKGMASVCSHRIYQINWEDAESSYGYQVSN